MAEMQPTAGRAEAFDLGPARLWRIRAPSQLRVRRALIRDVPPEAYLCLQLSGTTTFRLGAREDHLGPGDLAFGGGPSTSSFEMVCSEGVEHILLRLPSGMLSARHPWLEQTPHVFGASESGVRLLADAMQSAAREAPLLDSEQASLALASLLQLAGLARLRVTRATEEDIRVRRALRMIEEHLHDPDLDAKRIADACALSRRRLDQLFVRSLGKSVSACIVDVRLARARELIGDPRNSALGIATLAYATGFREAAPFSRLFRARFGHTPSQFRRTALAERPSTKT